MNKQPSKNSEQLKAVMLLATLKKSPEVSNTEAMCSVLADHLKREGGVKSEIIRLVDYNILPHRFGGELHLRSCSG